MKKRKHETNTKNKENNYANFNIDVKTIDKENLITITIFIFNNIFTHKQTSNKRKEK